MAGFEQALDEYLQAKRQSQSKHKSTSTIYKDNNNIDNNDNNTTHLYDYERYLYNEEKDLWYDTMTAAYYKYDITSQQYIPVYINSEDSSNSIINIDNNQVEEVTTTTPNDDEENIKNNGEPETDACCRIVVLNSKIVQEGIVKLVDANGITIGRDKHLWDERRWRLPDMEVSKYHCQIYYDIDKQYFSLIDVGSQNGTFLNGIRLSEKKMASSPYALKHGDHIQVGDTLLEIHNHENDWPCEKCQTSAVNQNNNNKNSNNENNYHSKEYQSLLKKIEGNKKSIDEHQLQRQERLKELKKLAYQQKNEQSSSLSSPSSPSSTSSSSPTNATIDRAKLRRENNRHLEKYYFQRQQQLQLQKELEIKEEIETDVVNVHTPVKGKGNDMLKKMGWKQGNALGSNQQGIMEPILPTMQQGRAGIGNSTNTTTINNHPISTKDQKWQKMQDRWAE